MRAMKMHICMTSHFGRPVDEREEQALSPQTTLEIEVARWSQNGSIGRSDGELQLVSLAIYSKIRVNNESRQDLHVNKRTASG